jgi:hypothetical protein
VRADAAPPTNDAADAAVATPFEPVSPLVYVGKVKNALTGLPPTEDEVDRVQADASALRGEIDGWMHTPQYRTKMRRFFELAFQQTQISEIDFADQVYPKRLAINASTTPLLVENAQESFARTMMQLIDDGRPLTSALTTHQVMLTTAMKELYAFLDVWQVDDAGKLTDRFRRANPALTITVEGASGPIAIAESVDPASPSYMHWFDPDLTTAPSKVAGCEGDPIVYPASAITLHYLLYGSLDGRKTAAGVQCPPSGGSAVAPQFTLSDFSDWTMVTVRPPSAGEAITPFYDLPRLRGATELVLSMPRVGFYGTPAFFANWQTNTSNQMRVTLNQTLIVALGSSVDGTDPTHTPGAPPPGLDAVHAGEGACLACHQTLDPLRSVFSANYSWNYHDQVDPLLHAENGLFSFRGVITPVTSLDEFGGVLATHPLLGPAWIQKLCYYVNSSACLETDPEFQRIVEAFKASGYSWNVAVAELLSSPIVTNASATASGVARGEVIAVSRRDHLCAGLNARLGFDDVCNLAANKKKTSGIAPIVTGLPSDGYGRGSAVPILPNEPTLFYRAGTENMCSSIAASVIDVPVAKHVVGVKEWSSAEPDAAVADFVAIVMGLVPSDPRSGPATGLLRAHFDAAIAAGATASDALKSAFVTACLAPSAVSIGL